MLMKADLRDISSDALLAFFILTGWLGKGLRGRMLQLSVLFRWTDELCSAKENGLSLSVRILLVYISYLVTVSVYY